MDFRKTILSVDYFVINSSSALSAVIADMTVIKQSSSTRTCLHFNFSLFANRCTVCIAKQSLRFIYNFQSKLLEFTLSK